MENRTMHFDGARVGRDPNPRIPRDDSSLGTPSVRPSVRPFNRYLLKAHDVLGIMLEAGMQC